MELLDLLSTCSAPRDKRWRLRLTMHLSRNRDWKKTTAFSRGYTTGVNPCLMVLLRKSWKIGLKMAQTVGSSDAPDEPTVGSRPDESGDDDGNEL